jgi:pimeloyl-ACP methyl ester carboxylesterase
MAPTGPVVRSAAVERDLVLFRDRPLLLCWGEHDPFIGAGERRRFAAAFSQHETLSIPHVGHFVPEDAPETMADAVSAWLQGGPC